MIRSAFRPTLAAVAAALALATLPAQAEKPEGVGGGKPQKAEKAEKADKVNKPDKAANAGSVAAKPAVANAKPAATVDIRIGGYFSDAQRSSARDWYSTQAKAGKCPPGLAKKNNGCLPPGQAKQWVVGQPLPRDVVFYPVPSTVSVRLGVPPAGYKYVRVAADILLIAVGTSMVIDAIEDLGRL